MEGGDAVADKFGDESILCIIRYNQRKRNANIGKSLI
jgi:hypothetical protein